MSGSVPLLCLLEVFQTKSVKEGIEVGIDMRASTVGAVVVIPAHANSNAESLSMLNKSGRPLALVQVKYGHAGSNSQL